MEDLFIENDGNRLAATIFRPNDKKRKNPAILFIPGWTGERKRNFQFAKSLVKLGYICFLVDLRGHGDSEGDINNSTHQQFLSDVFAAYDYLAEIDGVDPDNISAVGSSFGGYLASILSSKRKVKNLVLRVPANYPNDAFLKLSRASSATNSPEIIEWRKEARQPEDTYSLEALHNFDGSVLVIESELDEFVPHQTIENYMNSVKDKTKLTHVFMKDAPHSIREGKFRDEVEKIYLDWFRKTL